MPWLGGIDLHPSGFSRRNNGQRQLLAVLMQHQRILIQVARRAGGDNSPPHAAIWLKASQLILNKYFAIGEQRDATLYGIRLIVVNGGHIDDRIWFCGVVGKSNDL